MTDIEWAIKAIQANINKSQKYRDYYDGNHKLSFATQDFQNAFGSLFRAFALNMMPAVVDCVRDRLKLSGFTTQAKGQESSVDAEEGVEEAAADPIDSKILDIWRRNRMDQRAGRVHLNSLKAGDSYVIVWPDAKENPIIYPNQADKVAVLYDDEQPGRIEKACKAWVESDTQFCRLNLYYADRIEKYVTRQKVQGGLPDKAESFVKYEVEGEAWPLPNPYNLVPVFHFANNADIGESGTSELKDAIPLQDGLNKSVCDMLVSEEYHSMPQRWAIGIELPVDPITNKPMNPFNPGEMWATKAKDAKFGEFPGASLEPFVKVKNSWKEDIASVTGIPLHFFVSGGGTPPSGESLKTIEARLTAKVYDRQVSFGNVWESVFKLCLLIGGEADVELDAVWENTEPRDEGAQLANSILKVDSLGGSKRQAWREQGYSDEEITEIIKEREAEDNASLPPQGGQQTNSARSNLGTDLGIASRINSVTRADNKGTQLMN